MEKCFFRIERGRTKKNCVLKLRSIEHDLFGKVQNMLISKDYIIKEIIYEQDVEIIVFVDEGRMEDLTKLVNEVTNARCIIEPGNKNYISLDAQGKLIL